MDPMTWIFSVTLCNGSLSRHYAYSFVQPLSKAYFQNVELKKGEKIRSGETPFLLRIIHCYTLDTQMAQLNYPVQ